MTETLPAGYLRRPGTFGEVDRDIRDQAERLCTKLLGAESILKKPFGLVAVGSVLSDERFSAYDRGRRDMLNAILALNPEVARGLHNISTDDGTPFTNESGRLPFDVVFWVTAVAQQLGIEPKEA